MKGHLDSQTAHIAALIEVSEVSRASTLTQVSGALISAQAVGLF